MSKVRQRTALKAIARHWGAWGQIPVTEEMRSKHAQLKHCYAIYTNNRFEVQCFACSTHIGGVMQVVVSRHGNIEDVTEHELQRIKSELFGADRFAVEVYPSEQAKFVTSARLRILWVLPDTWEIPFGIQMKTSWGKPE